MQEPPLTRAQKLCIIMGPLDMRGLMGACYPLWPCRSVGGHFWLTDSWSERFFDPTTATHLAPMTLKHFFDAFALAPNRSIRKLAAAVLSIPEADVSEELVVDAKRAGMYDLTPIWVSEEPPIKRAKTNLSQTSTSTDVKMEENDIGKSTANSKNGDSDTSGSNSDVSSDDTSSKISDIEQFDEAYDEFGEFIKGVDLQVFERGGQGHTHDDVAGLELDPQTACRCS